MDTRAKVLHGVGLICAAAFCWSLGGLFVRAIEQADGWTIAFWRGVFVVIAVGAWLFAMNGARTFDIYRAMGWTGVLSGLLLSGCFVMYILAITRTSVANAVVLQSAAPLAAAVLARVILGETLSLHTIIAILVAIAGVALMFADALGGGDIVGNLLALGVGVMFGANIVVLRSARTFDMVPATVLAGLFTVVATIPMASIGSPSAHDFGMLAALGAVQLGLGLFLFIRGAQLLPAAQAGLLGLLEVILAPLWVWLVFSEVPAPLALLGGTIVLSALVAHSALGIRRRHASVKVA